MSEESEEHDREVQEAINDKQIEEYLLNEAEDARYEAKEERAIEDGSIEYE